MDANQMNAPLKNLDEWEEDVLRRYPDPETIAKAHASFTLILPEATGRFAVRFICASVSFSTAMLMALALPVIK